MAQEKIDTIETLRRLMHRVLTSPKAFNGFVDKQGFDPAVFIGDLSARISQFVASQSDSERVHDFVTRLKQLRSKRNVTSEQLSGLMTQVITTDDAFNHVVIDNLGYAPASFDASPPLTDRIRIFVRSIGGEPHLLSEAMAAVEDLQDSLAKKGIAVRGDQKASPEQSAIWNSQLDGMPLDFVKHYVKEKERAYPPR